MSELKERIPDETTLRKLVVECGPRLVTSVRSSVGSIEGEYKKFRRRRMLATFLFVGLLSFVPFVEFLHSLGVLIVLPESVYTLFSYLFIPIICGGLFVGALLTRSGGRVMRQFNKGVDLVVFEHAVTLLSLSGASIFHTQSESKSDYNISPIFKNHTNTAESEQVIALLTHSELITEAYNYTSIDNMLHLAQGNATLFVAELEVKNITGSGKNRQVKNIFRGYFVSFDLARPLMGKTFVSTEGDNTGFANQTLINNLLGSELTETTLEWNEFERLLRVTTTDEVEARYVLSTNFMHDLYEWWKDKRGVIRLSFVEKRLYMLFPDDNIRFHDTVPKIEEKVLTEYLFSIAKPLMHVVHLIEDVKV